MKKNKVKQPKKALKAIEELHVLVDQLRFFYPEDNRFRDEVLKRAVYIEDVLCELSIDKKIDHARFASKFKNLFNKENKELKKEIKEKEEKIKELTEEIKQDD
jgi:hypothetical protein